MKRLRSGELIAAGGAVVLFVSLFFSWYEVSAQGAACAETGGWSALGTPMSILLVVEIVLALTLAGATVGRRSPALPVALIVVTWVVGSLVWIILALRLLIEPDLGLGLAASQVTLRWPGYIGLLAAAAIPIGALQAMRDDRTDAPESAYTPPPPRPIPEPKTGGGSDTAAS